MLTKISPRQIWIYQLSSFGVYFYVWSVQKKKEMNLILNKKAIPSAWWFVLPFGGFWWMWQFASVLQDITKDQIKREEIFLLYMIAVFAWYFNPLPELGVKDIISNSFAYLLLAIAGHALFMSMVQSRINKLA